MNNTFYHFASPIYVDKHIDFLSSVEEVADEALSAVYGDLNEIFPVEQTTNFANDSRIEDFCVFIGNTAWNFLSHQGYDMSALGITIDTVWAQMHYKHSLMEQHVHPESKLIGFYFLETPKGCSRPMFHDPRPAKVFNFLPESSIETITPASNVINLTPEPGMLIISNSWLPHSFSRHASDEPLKFLHFNLGVSKIPQDETPSANKAQDTFTEII